MASAAAKPGAISKEKRLELAEKRKRDELVGKIRAMYAAAGADEPFGLGMAKMDVLKMHYDRARGFAGSRAQAGERQAREDAARGALKL